MAAVIMSDSGAVAVTVLDGPFGPAYASHDDEPRCSKPSSSYDSASTSVDTIDSPRSTGRDDEFVDSSVAAVEPSLATPAALTFTRCYTADGYEYFVNDVSGESVWTLPEGGVVQAQSDLPAEVAVTAPVLRWDSYGRPYYYYEHNGDWNYASESDWSMEFDATSQCHYFLNGVTGESSWFHPMHATVSTPASSPARSTYYSEDALGRQRAWTEGTRPVHGSRAWRRADGPGSVVAAPAAAPADDDDDDGATTASSSSDSDDDSSEDEEELLEELEQLDGAVVGLTFKQRAAVVRRASGKVLAQLSTAAAKLGSGIAERASPLLQRAVPLLQAARDNVEALVTPRKAKPELPLSARDARRSTAKFADADAAVYASMHKVQPLPSSPRVYVPPPRLGGATAPRTPKLRATRSRSAPVEVPSQLFAGMQVTAPVSEASSQPVLTAAPQSPLIAWPPMPPTHGV